MSTICRAPVPFEQLVAYWAGDLAPDAEGALEEHLMGCAECTHASARIAALTETFRGLIPPLLSRDMLEELTRRGLRILENEMRPDERREVFFPKSVDVLLHRLGGLDLTHAVQVSFVLRAEGTSRVLVAVDDAPFDREAGEVLVACQMHYAAMPPDTVAEVRARGEHGTERVTTYTILHRYEGHTAP